MVFKEVGITFEKPYKHFNLFLKLLKNIDKKPGKIKILDLGCGSGRHTVELARLGYEVYSIDLSRAGLELTNKQLKKKRLKAELKHADVFIGLPYEDNFFDAILAVGILYHSTLSNINNLVNEITRVLKKNGIYFGTSSISVKYSMYVNNGERYIQIENNTYFPLDGREKYLVHHYFSKKELLNLFSNPFKNVKIFEDNENYYVTTAIKK